MATVQIFNSSSQTVTITVNQGAQFTVNGTGPSASWVPQSPTSGGPTYTAGNAAPNVIGGQSSNSVQAFVNGTTIGGGPFSFTLPTTYPYGSVQLYLFFATVQSATWLVLTDGMIVAQQTVSMTLAASHKEHHDKK